MNRRRAEKTPLLGKTIDRAGPCLKPFNFDKFGVIWSVPIIWPEECRTVGYIPQDCGFIRIHNLNSFVGLGVQIFERKVRKV